MKSLYRTAPIGVVAVLLAGCATQSGQQLQSLNTNLNGAIAQYNVCMSQAYNSPEVAPLRAHVPAQSAHATLSQLADQSMMAPTERAAIFAMHEKTQQCTSAGVAMAAQSLPAIVPIVTEYQSRSNDNWLSVAQQKITWGEFNRRKRDIDTQTDSRLYAARRNTTAQLQQQNAVEMEQQRLAWQAFGEALSEAGQAYAQQQRDNAMIKNFQVRGGIIVVQ